MDLYHQHPPNHDLFPFNLNLHSSISPLPSTHSPNDEKQEENLDGWLNESSSEDDDENDVRVDWHITPFAFRPLDTPTPAAAHDSAQKCRQKVWIKRVEELRSFVQANGHGHIPTHTPRLGSWVAYVRRLRRQGSLSADRIEQLDELGFVWDARESTSSSSSPSGDPQVTATAVDNNAALARQTTRTEDDTRTEDALKEEGANGCCEEGEEEEEEEGTRGRSAKMDEKLFAGRVYQLRKFRQKHGHLRLGRTELARWLARMKRYHHVGLLARDKEAILRAVGVSFDGDKQQQSKQTREEYFDADREWEVEAILDKRMSAAVDDAAPQPFYEVKWKGYERTSWEPLDNLVGCAAMLKQFEKDKKAAEQQAALTDRFREDARRISVYSNFPEADCTVALRLSGGCRDLALLWLFTDPVEREWLESRVFKCSSASAQAELGVELSPAPTVRHSYGTRLASAAEGKKRGAKNDKNATRSTRPKRKGARYYYDEVDDEEEEEKEDGYGGHRSDEDDLNGRSGLDDDDVRTNARKRTKRGDAHERWDDDGGEEEEESDEVERRSGRRERRGLSREDAERMKRQEKARRNLASREARKATRDRKMSEEWERRRRSRQGARHEARRALAALVAQQQHQPQQHQQLQYHHHHHHHHHYHHHQQQLANKQQQQQQQQENERRAGGEQEDRLDEQQRMLLEKLFGRENAAVDSQWTTTNEAGLGAGWASATATTTAWAVLEDSRGEGGAGGGEEIELAWPPQGLYEVVPRKRNEGEDEQRPAHAAAAAYRSSALDAEQQQELKTEAWDLYGAASAGGGGGALAEEDMPLVDPLLAGIEF